ncbi:hypothetical protein GOP47_0022840 [Adiantum capillus-veneris]|uniref:RING-type E3 ubiquitin transferase n=1 Tax=Adiantum capillus-veneris TaxID=13818 RepID=A0A9D4U662_ADICA|nr:hypothetical protein GOP47_0022840 [Adiantum capillus-veneris]
MGWPWRLNPSTLKRAVSVDRMVSGLPFRLSISGHYSLASTPYPQSMIPVCPMDPSEQVMKQVDLFPSSDLPHPPSGALRADFVDSSDAVDASLEPPGLITQLTNLVSEISNLGEYRRIFRTECSNLTRRVKLLAPLFEEVKEVKGGIPDQAIIRFKHIEGALHEARELLKSCYSDSKIYLVLESEAVLKQFAAVTSALEQALDDLPYDSLEISDEVREQVELVHTQLKRAKGRADAQDVELYNDVAVLSQESDKAVTTAALERLAEKLHLKTLSDIKQEERALNRALSANGGAQSERLTEMTSLLDYFKKLSINDNGLLDVLDNEKSMQSEKLGSPIIPDDFRCPISLELMKDPVIVATGQTYERSCIQKWLDAGNRTCPKTQQVLAHLILTPNYVLKSLIAQWCEIHGVELPKKIPSGERQTIDVLLQKLSLGQPDVQRAAAGEIRMLAKRNAENRVCIAEAGAIPLLVKLLSSADPRTQEHAVTALLNLSIHDGNKGMIVSSGAIDPIVEVLKNGSMEARENAAATLFSLSVVDDNKITIGASGAIPALGNKAKAVRALVVPPLMQLLKDPSSDMVDEALAILAILATHHEGRAAISQASATPVLVELIKTGSPRNKENAAAVLLALCLNDVVQTALVGQLGAHGPLIELAKNGTGRGRRKASSLLDHMNRHEKAAPDLV